LANRCDAIEKPEMFAEKSRMGGWASQKASCAKTKKRYKPFGKWCMKGNTSPSEFIKKGPRCGGGFFAQQNKGSLNDGAKEKLTTMTS